jgi:UDP-N-acetylmuramoyl-L-alanyl-D-glutamate--2,6-diaminopimelate ligase
MAVASHDLNGLLDGTGARALRAAPVSVTGIAYRSDRVVPGDAFFCVKGFSADGHDFASDAVSRGAAALVVERELDLDVPQFVVADSRVALAQASARSVGEPSRTVDIVGVTGTNGKTTTCYLIDAIMRRAGRVTGLIGTVETRIADTRVPSSRTTPESADLQYLLGEMRDAGVTGVAMEVSSHAIDLHRVDSVRFAVAAFTNLTQDHLDFHHTIEEYASVKKRLFTDFEVGAAVVDTDDPFGAAIASDLPDVISTGLNPSASVRATEVDSAARGSHFTLIAPEGSVRISLPLAGAYNVSNALTAAGCAIALGIDLPTIAAALSAAPQVPGRLERVECGQPFGVIVDYAHTPDSLEKAIKAVTAVTEGKTIVVFGCGGDRDPDKRPMMGKAAAENAHYTVVTSDNPRSEDPVGIILQIEDGIRAAGGRFEAVVDRKDAIERAILMAAPGDTVLIAGKGHEDYQVFSDRTVHFDDREVAREVLGRC